jgi:hypothetical protein
LLSLLFDLLWSQGESLAKIRLLRRSAQIPRYIDPPRSDIGLAGDMSDAGSQQRLKGLSGLLRSGWTKTIMHPGEQEESDVMPLEALRRRR